MFLYVHVDDIKMVGEKQDLGPMWTILRRDIDLEDPTPLLNQVYLGCTQSEAAVESCSSSGQSGLSRRITTTEVTNVAQSKKKYIHGVSSIKAVYFRANMSASYLFIRRVIFHSSHQMLGGRCEKSV